MLEEGEIEEGEISDEENWSVKPPENPPLNPLITCDGKNGEPVPEVERYGKVLELVSSVTAQSACKYLAATCLQLYDALEILGELPPDASIVSQIFRKIQVVFHLYEVVPLEIKLQASANLTKLSSLFKENIFTESQSVELHNLSQAIKPPEVEPTKSIKPEAEPKTFIKPHPVEPKKFTNSLDMKNPSVQESIPKPIQENNVKKPSVQETIPKPIQENNVKKQSVPAYMPWEDRQDDITQSYAAYVSSFRMEDLPSPTPSAGDEAARYGTHKFQMDELPSPTPSAGDEAARYGTTKFKMDELPSPTPSAQDEAARYGTTKFKMDELPSPTPSAQDEAARYGTAQFKMDELPSPTPSAEDKAAGFGTNKLGMVDLPSPTPSAEVEAGRYGTNKFHIPEDKAARNDTNKFGMVDLPSPTPSSEDEAARYGANKFRIPSPTTSAEARCDTTKFCIPSPTTSDDKAARYDTNMTDLPSPTPSAEDEAAQYRKFRMVDLPSPTPSAEDEAARYGARPPVVRQVPETFTAKHGTVPVATNQVSVSTKPIPEPVVLAPVPFKQPVVVPRQVTDPVAARHVQESEPQPALKSRDPRKNLISGVASNFGKPRVASILKKREAPQNHILPDLKRPKLEPELVKPAVPLSGSGGWLEGDSNTEDVPAINHQPVHLQPMMMKPRDPRRALVANMPRPIGPMIQPNLVPVQFGPPNQFEDVHQNGFNDPDLHPELREILDGLDEYGRMAILNERQRRMDEHETMIGAKKLCLVLDLDHTLLNSAKFSEIEPEWEKFLRSAEVMERTRDLYRFPHMAMWTKLRPGIWRFLSRASELFEMHLYTMGNKAYATEMAKLLDPTGVMFSGRVISKGDDGLAAYGDEKLPRSKDLDGVLGMESAAIIIDDSARVWPHHRDNLIVVERYMYFPSSRKQFGLPGPSLLEVGHDEREADGMLASVLGVIERIHFNLFLQPRPKEVDVRKVLAVEQRRIFQGCKIVFSRIIPVGEVQPQLHPLWRSAEQFGAVCTTVLEPDVTHVVALSLGTDKVNWALSTGKHLVRPEWIEASTILYRRANERDFPVPA